MKMSANIFTRDSISIVLWPAKWTKTSGFLLEEVGGIAALLQPLVVDFHLLFIDMVVMILFTVFFQVFITTDKAVTRMEGAVLFSGYLAYMGYLGWYVFL